MVQTADTHQLFDTVWRQRLLNFGLTVMATVVGGLLLAGLLWGIGALNQVSSLTTKVDMVEEKVTAIEAKADTIGESLARGLDDLKASVANLPNGATLKNIDDSLSELRVDVDKMAIHGLQWRQEVELRLTVLEHPVGGAPEDDQVNSLDPSLYLPRLKRGSRR